MVEVMPNSDREVDDKDVPTILLSLFLSYQSLAPLALRRCQACYR